MLEGSSPGRTVALNVLSYFEVGDLPWLRVAMQRERHAALGCLREQIREETESGFFFEGGGSSYLHMFT